MVFLNQKNYGRRVNRTVGTCLCVLLAMSMPMPVVGQSGAKLPKRLLPAPGNAGISLTFSGAKTGRPVVTSNQHPLFEASWTGSPSEIVAQTKYGPVSSRDLYLWMILRESPNKAYMFELMKKTRLPKDRKKLADALKVEVDEFVFANYVVPRLMPGAPADPVYDLKHYVYTLPAWQTVFLQKVVQPGVHISEADRVKYLQENSATIIPPQRLRVRYIFRKSAETDSFAAQAGVEHEMRELRERIVAGEVDFAAAARQHSEAPSASRGGEIPPFQHGELFFLFEDAAAELEPGEVSRVFYGPNGYYMVQLIEVLEPAEPSLANREQAEKVDEGLSRLSLKAAYDIYMRDMLLERRRIVERVGAWDSLEEGEVLGEVCDFVISKSQFRSAWPSVEDNNLRLRTDVIVPQLRTMLEREAMAQEVRDLGHAGDPMLERARWMAGNIIRRDAWIEQLRASLPISEELVRKFWQDNRDLFTPLALKRVIKLTLVPSNTAPMPSQTLLEMDSLLASVTGDTTPVTVARREEQDEERSSRVYDYMSRTREAVEMLTSPAREPNYYLDDFSTRSLQQMMVEDSDVLPSLQDGEPAPELDVIESPQELSTDTLSTLVDTADDTQVLDLETTGPQGGAAPTPAAGGNRPQEILPGRTVASSFNPETRPATRPQGGPVPVGVTGGASPAPLQYTPHVRKQARPPETSAIPYNPDWFYGRIDESELREAVSVYGSSDWLLQMQDLGFVYVPDIPDAPARLEKVPVGAFSRPIIVDQVAVSWYIEEARTVETPPFEEIKTHVYDVFRDTQLDQAVSRTYNSELEKANINYKF